MSTFQIFWLVLTGLMVIYLIIYIIWISKARTVAKMISFEAMQYCNEKTVVGTLQSSISTPFINYIRAGNIVMASATAIGGRESQQDAVQISAVKTSRGDRAFAILCDGMGGMQDGERASKLAINVLSSVLSTDTEASNVTDTIISALKEADGRIAALGDENGRTIRSGTTAVTAVIENAKLHWASVGDSRIYHLRDGAIKQITTDHNLMMKLKRDVADGLLSIEEAFSNPKRNALISYLGMGELHLIDSDKGYPDLRQGDFVLLSSDGLFKVLSEEEISRIVFTYSEDIKSAVKVLTETALLRGGYSQDNTTVVLIKNE
ncbi:MAG: protein phosphatase 2C domain-containing protein [Oscillospiraceae bacterium]